MENYQKIVWLRFILLVMCMFSLENQCLSREKQSEKVIRFAAREGVFGLPDAEILIVWKGKIMRMRTNQIGDGMLIPLVYERGLFNDVDWAWAVYGLSLYQEYNEDTDHWKTYLWKYPGGEEGMEATNALSKQFNLGVSVEKEGKFVQIFGGNAPQWEGERLEIDQALGFLVGICLGYGTPKNKTDQSIMTWQVNLPCLGEIMRHEAIIKHALEVCCEYGIFVIHSDIQQRDLTVWNWTIHDPELVGLLRAIWTQTRPVSVLDSSTERLAHEYLEQNGGKGDYVLKFVGK